MSQRHETSRFFIGTELQSARSTEMFHAEHLTGSKESVQSL